MANVYFNTKSRTKYIKTRTVCIPTSYIESLEDKDTLHIEINRPDGGVNSFSASSKDIKKNAQLRSKNGRRFYVYKY